MHLMRTNASIYKLCVCIYIYIHLHMCKLGRHIAAGAMQVYEYICMYVCMYVYIYVCATSRGSELEQCEYV